MRHFRLAWALAALGCVGAVAAEKPAPVPVPCGPRAQLPPVDLKEIFLRHGGEIELKSGAGCLKTDTGQELPAILLALPAFESAYGVRFEAPVGNSAYLEPRVEMLDEQFQVVRAFGAERLKRRGTEMSLQVFVEPANSAERYVLLYADPAHMTDTDKKTSAESQTLFVGTGFIVLGNEKTRALSASVIGKLNVTLVGEQWDAALKAAKSQHH